MSDPTDNELENSEEQVKRRKRTEGESDGGAASGVSGYARASGDGVAKLPVNKLKEVMADWRQLDMNEVVAAVAEFFSDFPARASANLQVKWDATSKGGFAIVNMAIKFGQDVATAIRERTRESSVRIRQRYGINIRVRPGSKGVVQNNPNPGGVG